MGEKRRSNRWSQRGNYLPKPASQVEAPSHTAVHTRLRPSARDEQVLWALAEETARLRGHAWSARSSYGAGFTKDEWNALFHLLRGQGAPKVWADALAAEAKGQWRTARAAQRRERTKLLQALAMLDGRLALPIGQEGTGKGRTPKARGGYATPAEHRAKQRRRDVLAGRLARLEDEVAAGRVSLCAGGKGLARARHHLEDSGFADEEAWRRAWVARRGHLSAPGRARSVGGNTLLRVDADTGRVTVVLPDQLAHLANHQPRGATLPHYRFDNPVVFSHRGGQWRQAVTDRQAVTYRLRFDPQARKGRGGWYLTAVFAPPETGPEAAAGPADEAAGQVQEAASSGPIVGVDLNADHLACRLVTADGSPTRHHTRIPLEQTGTARQRDARVREALDALLSWALEHGARRVAIEDLDFATGDAATVRETTQSRSHRRLRAGIPTGRLRHRLASMAATRGVAVTAVDAAYSTVHGRKWWAGTTPTIPDPDPDDRDNQTASDHDQTSRTKDTQTNSNERGRRRHDSHLAAATVIGRRALRLRDARSYGDHRVHQRMDPATPRRQGPPDPGAHASPGGSRTRPSPPSPLQPEGTGARQDATRQPAAAESRDLKGPARQSPTAATSCGSGAN